MIYPVTMYAGKCDACDDKITLMGEFAALSEPLHVKSDMEDSGWHIDGDKHYCPDCWSYDDEDNIVIKLKNKKQ